MAYQAAVVGAAGYAGAELLRLLAGHPDLQVTRAVAAGHAGSPVAELYPALAPAYRGLVLDAWDSGSLDGVDVAFLTLPHGESQRVVPDLLGRVGHVVDLGADFRLPAAAYEQWYGAPHTAPGLLDQFAFGLPELFRDDITADRGVAVPGCYPTAAILALAPLLTAGLAAPEGLVVHAASGISGRGRGLSDPSLFAEANETVTPYGLLTHRHTGEIDWALSELAGTPIATLFTPHLVPMTRGLLASCYARPAADSLSTARLLDAYRDAYGDEAFVVVADEPPTTRRPSARTRRTSRPASIPGRGPSWRSPRSTTSGRARPARPSRPRTACSACPSDRPARGRDGAVSVIAAPGFAAAAAASGVKPDARTRPRARRDRRPPPVAGRRRLHDQPAAAAPVQVSRDHLRDGRRAAAVVLNSGNANAATGEAGRDTPARMCQATAAALGCAADEVLVCSTGLIGIPLPIDVVERRHRRRRPRWASDAAAGAGAADAIRTTDTVTKEASVADADGSTRSAAWRRARRCSRRRWRRCSPCSRPTPAATPPALDAALRRAVHDTFNALIVDVCMSTNDTVLVLANGQRRRRADRAERPRVRGVRRRAHRGLRPPGRGHGRRRRGGDQGGPSRRGGRGEPRRGPPCRPRGRRAANSSVLPLRGGPLLGPCALRARGQRRGVRPRARRHRVQRDHGLPRRRRRLPRRRGPGRGDGAARRSRSSATCTPGPTATAVRFTDLTHAYIDENMGRHDRRAASSTPPRKAAILAEALPYIRRVRRQHRRHQVRRQRAGRARPRRAASPRTSCSCASSGCNPVVVHGGGPQIGDLMRRLGKEPEFVDGLRVTDAETLDIVRMVLVGKVNREIVTALNATAPTPSGCLGRGRRPHHRRQRDPALGFVGDVAARTRRSSSASSPRSSIPVVATIGVDDAGQAHNINADTAAGAIAAGARRREAGLPHRRRRPPPRRRRRRHPRSSRVDVAGLEPLLADGRSARG